MEKNYIPRAIESTIQEAASYFPVIAITGPRQSGKSTLLRHIFPTYQWVSLKDLNVLEFAQSDPVAFLSQTSNGMIIDEVQKAPRLLEHIQVLVDNDSNRKFALTGSANFELLRTMSESLAGRAGVFELLPMSMTEVPTMVQKMGVDNLLFEGLYPAICAEKNKAKFFYPSYVRTYLEKDVRDLLHVKDQMLFMRFLKLCAARIGSLFNASELATEVGVDSKTITHWLSVLQASYIIALLPPYYENISKRLVKSPKLYFYDTGLACYLLNIESASQLERDKMRGALFENLIVSEILKYRYNKGLDDGVFFYRDAKQHEVDILLRENGELIAIEVKSAMTYNTSFAKTLLAIATWIHTPIRSKNVIYTGEYENGVGDIKLFNYKNLPLTWMVSEQ